MCVGLWMPWVPGVVAWGPGKPALSCQPMVGCGGLWWAVVDAVGRQGALLHPLPPLTSLCWQIHEEYLLESISPRGRDPRGGVGAEKVRLVPPLMFLARNCKPATCLPAFRTATFPTALSPP